MYMKLVVRFIQENFLVVVLCCSFYLKKERHFGLPLVRLTWLEGGKNNRKLYKYCVLSVRKLTDYNV